MPRTLPRSAARTALPGERRSRPAPTSPPARVRPALEQVVPRRPARHHGSRLARSEARLVRVAVACTTVVCALLVLYLAAYAHVMRLGIEQSQARAGLRAARLQNEVFKADCARLENPRRVAAAAAALGMTPRAQRVDYIAVPSAVHNARIAANALPSDTNSLLAKSGR